MTAKGFVSIDAAIGPQHGAILFFRKPTTPVGLQVFTTDPLPASVEVALEGSLDGVNFFAMPVGPNGGPAQVQTGHNFGDTAGGFTGSVGIPVVAARAFFYEVSGSGTFPNNTTVTALISGDD